MVLRAEILEAIKKINKKNLKLMKIILIVVYILNGIPDPEIMIRTGNTTRLSNFLLWQLAYTEIFFLKKLWPDFNNKI